MTPLQPDPADPDTVPAGGTVQESHDRRVADKLGSVTHRGGHLSPGVRAALDRCTEDMQREADERLRSTSSVWTRQGPLEREPAPAAIDRRLHPDGKGRYDLLSPHAVRAWALRLEHGAAIHPERGWQHLRSPDGQAVLMSKALRHLHQAAAGQDDEDHLAAALTNIGFLIDLRERATRVDDVGPRVGG